MHGLTYLHCRLPLVKSWVFGCTFGKNQHTGSVFILYDVLQVVLLTDATTALTCRKSLLAKTKQHSLGSYGKRWAKQLDSTSM